MFGDTAWKESIMRSMQKIAEWMRTMQDYIERTNRILKSLATTLEDHERRIAELEKKS